MKKAETHSSKHFFQIIERLTEMSFLVSIILSTFFCHNSHNTSFYRNKRGNSCSNLNDNEIIILINIIEKHNIDENHNNEIIILINIMFPLYLLYFCL